MIREVLSLDGLRTMSPSAAAALLAVRRSDGQSDHDARLIEAWLALDEANRKAWARTEASWHAFDDGADDEILQAMRQAARRAGPERIRVDRRAAAIAATVLVLVGGATLAVFLRDRPGHAPPPVVVAQTEGQTSNTAGAHRYETGAERPRRVDLPDGSHVTLAAATILEVKFEAKRRDLRLVRGRAFFDVAHDASRPFVVAAGDRQVTAVGTQFDVLAAQDKIRVVLVQGRVSVRAPGAASPPTLLSAGQALDASAGQSAQVRPANIDEVLDWQQGYVTFDDMPLSAAVIEMNRWSLDQITVVDPRVGRLRISGRFQTDSLARFGRTLAQIHPVRLVQRGPHRFEIIAAR